MDAFGRWRDHLFACRNARESRWIGVHHETLGRGPRPVKVVAGLAGCVYEAPSTIADGRVWQRSVLLGATRPASLGGVV